MSENLIYGADITSYGALGDGITDCSGAFNTALKNGESLISVPYGNYVLKNPIFLGANTHLQIHPNAVITFLPEKDGSYPMIYAENCGSIIIEGGIFEYNAKECDDAFIFGFNDIYGLRICKCVIKTENAGAIRLKNCQCTTIADIKLYSSGNGIEIFGETEDITIKKVAASIKSSSFISLGNEKESCTLNDLYVRNTTVERGQAVFSFDNGKAEKVRIENVNAVFEESFLKIGKAFTSEDTEIEDIITCHVSEIKSDNAYFHLCGSCDSLEIRNFKRDSENESFPLSPTLIFKDAHRSKILTDGVALDNVIASRGKSKSIAMTTARLTNPWGKFTYTLECKIKSGDTFTLPTGDFEYLRQDRT